MKPAWGQHMNSAENWLLRLKWSGCTPEDREAFDRWRAVPEHAAAYERTEQLWTSFDRFTGNAAVEQMAKRVMVAAASRTRWQGSRLSLALAALLAIVLTATVAYVSRPYFTPTATYTTEAGERSTIRLSDGSEVMLNVGTRLEVKLSDSRRQFKLVHGEAVFVVAKDTQRPFTVAAGKGTVRALGTYFQVRNESTGVIVTLLEGRIAVARDDSSQHIQLEPGEQVKFTSASDEILRRTIDPDVVSSWTTGRLQFHSTPLTEVVDEVNRYTRTQIRLGDPSLATVLINGTFELGDSVSLVSALEAALSIEAVSGSNEEIVLLKGSK